MTSLSAAISSSAGAADRAAVTECAGVNGLGTALPAMDKPMTAATQTLKENATESIMTSLGFISQRNRRTRRNCYNTISIEFQCFKRISTLQKNFNACRLFDRDL
jgi:hypothetical protein